MNYIFENLFWIVPSLMTLFIIFMTVIIAKNQGKILNKQIMLHERQTDIMEVQNNIALYDKRYIVSDKFSEIGILVECICLNVKKGKSVNYAKTLYLSRTYENKSLGELNKSLEDYSIEFLYDHNIKYFIRLIDEIHENIGLFSEEVVNEVGNCISFIFSLLDDNGENDSAMDNIITEKHIFKFKNKIRETHLKLSNEVILVNNMKL